MNTKRVLQIFRDGKPETRFLNVPLLDGEQGNLQTIAEMIKIVREDRLQPDLRAFIMREIVGNVAGHDTAGELQAIFDYAQHRIVYRRDPFGVERVADVWSTLYALNPGRPEGDCGIKSMFIASCAATLGYKPFFVVIKQTPHQATFNHIYAMVAVDGRKVYMDATPEDKPMGYQASAVERYLVPILD